MVNLTKQAADELNSFVTRIEAMNGEIKDLANDRADIFKEAKDRGYDTPAIRTIIKEREEKRKDSASYENRLATTDTYRSVIGLMKTGRPVPEPKSEEPPVSDTPPEKKTEKLEIPPVFRNAAVD
jgi:uncharacterized protein (UPF0335 family)